MQYKNIIQTHLITFIIEKFNKNIYKPLSWSNILIYTNSNVYINIRIHLHSYKQIDIQIHNQIYTDKQKLKNIKAITITYTIIYTQNPIIKTYTNILSKKHKHIPIQQKSYINSFSLFTYIQKF